MKINISSLRNVVALAGFARAQFQDFFNITEFPKEQKDNVTRWMNDARTLAGPDLYAYFAHRCILGQVYPELSSATQIPGFIAPHEVFDRLYYIGQSAVSAWAYDTGDGLIVFDALNNAVEAEGILIPSLEKLGFSASDIKHLVITHEHFDHYGGARWLQDNFSFATYASAAAWETLSQTQDGPIKDKTISDGDQLTIGNITFNFFVTPGHTPGTVSSIFEVSDKGAKHVAGFYGGVGIPSSASAKDQQIVSLNRFADLAKEAGVDTLIASHQNQDRALYHFDLLDHRPDGTEHPFVIGTDAFNRYLKVNGQCVRVKAARDGQFLQI
ncbi:hypothetical protein HER10_EVM0004092 [Colletotrichum scovillei]|uniref:Beta-lactamase domain protein n=1 Tax=Colletotrichum scovillei TaxID=1209932 RepID=A0A9P7U3R8_9PEZI|nr:uncharacterized protein HER10_EVM0004092 [Colletotrichum scovillei]KAF4773746.1 hypothetical protein HER10_EVM0004092 [Colletotrichum scovillei]KAG7038781.1 beta-lactamase domain protein [Colletotrichum scovillei]KAG7040961.1 beta-lactamase domain protein [Colletotrichum scovillei]KAG7060994.1 beta-lactamase domain protein [Colletotrichum scovillei]